MTDAEKLADLIQAAGKELRLAKSVLGAYLDEVADEDDVGRTIGEVRKRLDEISASLKGLGAEILVEVGEVDGYNVKWNDGYDPDEDLDCRIDGQKVYVKAKPPTASGPNQEKGSPP